jgi:hypothetical protein
MKGVEVSILLSVMTCAAFCLHMMQRNHGAMVSFSHQVAGLDTKMNSLRATVDFQHKITTTMLDDEDGQLSQIHSILLELLKQQQQETPPSDP